MAAKKAAAQKTAAKAKAKRRGGILTFVVLFALLAVFGAELLRLHEKIAAATVEREELSRRVAAQEQENKALKSALDRADDPEYLQELARERLSMVSPGQKDFYDVSN